MAGIMFQGEELIPVSGKTGPFKQASRYHYPVSPKEGVRGMFRRNPIWQITGSEEALFSPACVPDNVARCGPVAGDRGQSL